MTKLKPIKTLKNKALRLVRDVAFFKFGKFCHVQRYYPHINIRHTEIIQGDHIITRSCTYFIFDFWCIMPVCSSCNQAKAFGNKSVHRAIDEMAEKRNPKWFKDAVWVDQSKEGNHNFSKRWWLNEVISDLGAEMEKLKGATK